MLPKIAAAAKAAPKIFMLAALPNTVVENLVKESMGVKKEGCGENMKSTDVEINECEKL